MYEGILINNISDVYSNLTWWSKIDFNRVVFYVCFVRWHSEHPGVAPK
jgi:hypothetical protein